MKRLVLSLDKHCSFLFPFYTWRKYEGSVCEIRWIFQWFQKANMRALGPRVSQLYTASILYMKSQNSITIIFTIKSLFKKFWSFTHGFFRGVLRWEAWHNYQIRFHEYRQKLSKTPNIIFHRSCKEVLSGIILGDLRMFQFKFIQKSLDFSKDIYLWKARS